STGSGQRPARPEVSVILARHQPTPVAALVAVHADVFGQPCGQTAGIHDQRVTAFRSRSAVFRSRDDIFRGCGTLAALDGMKLSRAVAVLASNGFLEEGPRLK